MKVTWVLLLALGVVSADVSLGYHYKVPQTSYGVPSYQIGSNSGQYSSGISGSQSGYQGLGSGYQGAGYQGAGSGYQGAGYQGVGSGYQGAGYQGAGYQGAGYQGSGYQSDSLQSGGLGSGYYQSSGSSVGTNVVRPSQQYSSNLGTGFQTQYESSSQYQSAAHQNYQQYFQVQEQPAKVFKHFYVHAAPEEPEQVKPRVPIVLPAPQKHYKIIFVKAPTESSSPNVIAPIQPQSEEKTIVYVLVKKPDDKQDIVLPKIEQKPPSKPEVYFIKYKNKEDSQAVINNIVKDYNKGEPLSLVNSGSGESSYQSGISNIYQTPSSSSTGSYSTSQNFDLSSSSGSGADLGQSNFVSSISSPVTVSSTASSISYDDAAISTSQGIPHETYGPPKFRAN